MSASTASSESGNSSDDGSNSPINQESRVELSQNGSRKRRRLSPTGESDSESEVQEAVKPASKPQSRITPSSTMSRIKAKPSGTTQTTPATDVPASIAASLTGNEKSTFASLNISPWLINSLSQMAIKSPTKIQSAAIPEILKGRDCIGGSRTGSGKTVAFAVPILQQWAKDPFGIFALVLTPTRELALQIFEQFKAIGACLDLKVVLVTGGGNMKV